MTTQVMVRAATPDDVDAIRRIAGVSWEATYADFMANETFETLLAEGYTPEHLEGIIESDVVELFVAVTEEIVGFATSEPPVEGSIGHVSTYVAPDCWGEGIGTALLERAIEHLDEQGTERVQDIVLAENDVGNAFYGEHFEKTDETVVEMGGQEFDANVYATDL